jgi:hypothetical protein
MPEKYLQNDNETIGAETRFLALHMRVQCVTATAEFLAKFISFSWTKQLIGALSTRAGKSTYSRSPRAQRFEFNFECYREPWNVLSACGRRRVSTRATDSSCFSTAAKRGGYDARRRLLLLSENGNHFVGVLLRGLDRGGGRRLRSTRRRPSNVRADHYHSVTSRPPTTAC